MLSINACGQILEEMTVEEIPAGEGLPYVVRDGRKAVLIVHSQMAVMSFASNMGIIKVDNPDPGEYILHLLPGTHIITFKSKGFSPNKQRFNIQPKNYREVKVFPSEPNIDEYPVTILIEPVPDQVTVDGKTVDISGSIKLEVGKHSLAANKSGYQKLEATLTVSENDVFFKYEMEKPKLCVVEVSTEPSGAEVWIDGVKMQGTTPISDFFNSGHYPIRITRDKYLPVEETIFIEQAKAKSKFSYRMEPNIGFLTINTNPGAKVYLNDELTENLERIELSPQSAGIRIEKPKCTSRETTVIIRKGSDETVDLYLDEETGMMAISVDPPEAEIELNGDAGEHYTSTGTKIFENIPVGSYELEVSLKGYKTDKRILRLRADETLRERVTLEEGSDGIQGPLPGMVFVEIPTGTFEMGSPSNESGRYDYEGPVHTVRLSSFYMMTTEVTQAMWREVMGNNPSYFKGDNNPVERVSWNDCQEFLKKLNERDPGKKYRLPTEAEWEYACRAGTTTPFYTGSTISTDQANYDGNYTYGNGRKGVYREKTIPVGSFSPNPWGLYDMHGNVWEWCEDWYHSDYNGAPSNGSAWTSPSGSYRVLRGGSWGYGPRYCRCAYRDRYSPDEAGSNVGFRVVFR